MADDLLNILDSEIEAMDKGPIKWAREHQETSMDLEGFRRAIIEQFADIGFRVQVKCFETSQKGVFAFDFEIVGRTEKKEFDFDRMVHEVTSNYLDDPGAEKGFIKAPVPTEDQRRKHKHSC